MTPGQKWRLRRNLAICLCWRGGMSQRMIADVFDLPRSHIAGILKATEALAETGTGGNVASQTSIHHLPGFSRGRTGRFGPGG